MNWILELRIPMRPQGKQRARAIGKKHYTPPETVAFERTTANVARREMRLKNLEPLTGGVALEVTAYFATPKSASKATVAKMLSGKECHTVKPDASNIAKAVEDALNGIAYRDDSQIVQLFVTKAYAVRDEIHIKAMPYENPTLEELTT